MEDLAAAMWELAQSVGSLKTAVDESQSILRELVAGRPPIHGVMHEVRVGVNNDNSSVGGVAPAKCSMVGFGPIVNGVEAVASPLQPKVTFGATGELDANRAKDPNDLNITLPARCSMQCFPSNKDDVKTEQHL
jgi:hypothetical protein